MEHYIDESKADFSAVEEYVNEFYSKVKDEIDNNNLPFLKLKKILLISMGITCVLSLLFLIIFFVQFSIVFLIFAILFFAIGLAVFIFYSFQKRKSNSKNLLTIEDYFNSRNISIYEELFPRVFKNAKFSDTDNHFFNFSIEKIVEKFKFNLKGEKLIGIVKTYEIINGSFFNKPINLSCAVYKSETRREKNENGVKKVEIETFFEYLPLLRIKINSFDSLNLVATNSKSFSYWRKNKLNFDNIDFRKKISVQSNNDLETFMIFTALTQEKWVEGLSNSPNILLDISNGYINVLFKPSINEFQTETPFMNISDYYLKIKNSEKFFNNISEYLSSDFSIFIKILNLIFCIPYFQWEDKKSL